MTAACAGPVVAAFALALGPSSGCSSDLRAGEARLADGRHEAAAGNYMTALYPGYYAKLPPAEKAAPIKANLAQAALYPSCVTAR